MRKGLRAFRAAARGAGAFTLLELMVVLFVLSIMLTLVLPYFNMSGDDLDAQARQMASVLRYLNETAASRKETMEIKFDLAKRLVTWSESGSEKAESFETLKAVELQSRGTLTDGELTVFFGPTGLGEFLNVYLSDGGVEKTVAFNPISGRVSISEGEAVDKKLEKNSG
jgi:general secretion pathway protein H